MICCIEKLSAIAAAKFEIVSIAQIVVFTEISDHVCDPIPYTLAMNRWIKLPAVCFVIIILSICTLEFAYS